MARGSGVANGLLVPLTAIIVAVIVGAIATGSIDTTTGTLRGTECDVYCRWPSGSRLSSTWASNYSFLKGGANP